jgi:hypothetical protein
VSREVGPDCLGAYIGCSVVTEKGRTFEITELSFQQFTSRCVIGDLLVTTARTHVGDAVLAKGRDKWYQSRSSSASLLLLVRFSTPRIFTYRVVGSHRTQAIQRIAADGRRHATARRRTRLQGVAYLRRGMHLRWRAYLRRGSQRSHH